MCVEGKNGFKTWIISAYRQYKSYGLETAYTQHLLYFRSKGEDREPRQAFMDDLKMAILAWQNDGEEIILTGDFNTGDKKTLHEKDRFWKPWLTDLGLIDVHQTHLAQPMLPATYERGTTQIDHILISQNLSIHRAGFLPFSKFPGDHRAIWVDIPIDNIIGFKPAPLHSPNARKLILNPKVVKKYVNNLKDLINKEELATQIRHLETIPAMAWITKHTERFDNIAQLFCQCMIKAQSKCRTLYSGKYPWSPAFAEARNKNFFWELIVKHLLGVKIPMRKLLKLKCKLNIKQSKVTLDSAIHHSNEARNDYIKKIKKQSTTLQKGYLEYLADI